LQLSINSKYKVISYLVIRNIALNFSQYTVIAALFNRYSSFMYLSHFEEEN